MRIFERVFGKILMTFAHEYYQFTERMTVLFNERIPGLSVELLPEWETDLGLPDECSGQLFSIAIRQRAAHTKYTAKYTGLSKQFYLDYALDLGSTIVIEPVNPGGNPFRVDISRVDRTPAEGVDGARLWSTGINFKWIIKILDNDPNRHYLRCKFEQIKPAWTQLIWVEVPNF